MKNQDRNEQDNGEDSIENEMKCVGNWNQKPGGSQCEKNSVRKKMKKPKTRTAEGVRE